MRKIINGVVGAFIVPTAVIFPGNLTNGSGYPIPIFNRGFGNGYVIVDKSNPYYGKQYDEVNHTIYIHGGLTFSGGGVNEVEGQIWLQKPPEDLNWEDLYVFGFDTAHLGDNKDNCDRAYVTTQVWSLFNQLGQSKRIAEILSKVS